MPSHCGASAFAPTTSSAHASALAEVYDLHAAGATYEFICRKLAELEERGGIRRRSGQRYDLDFGDALGDRNRSYDAALTAAASTASAVAVSDCW